MKIKVSPLSLVRIRESFFISIVFALFKIVRYWSSIIILSCGPAILVVAKGSTTIAPLSILAFPKYLLIPEKPKILPSLSNPRVKFASGKILVKTYSPSETVCIEATGVGMFDLLGVEVQPAKKTIAVKNIKIFS